ncbi:class A beta-lactamase [Pseudoduganella albidiflava]|uniref:beta-lactamase n=1 Tax=Pseudoduganella albidiflava TaxID=321983 RepID=A0A411WZK6_9BURK|nr:class A beta-lactamase [Pseudoduganella albidiflava]QBI02154.1 class A beta-lactamase [Pseudoduganella albidiflava]GGY60114.1 beta-lactamase [Pseudoduganella albidiflava]
MTITRRTLLLAAAAAPFAPSLALSAPTGFSDVERDLRGRLGVAVIDTATGKTTGHRLGERFPMCSTFKAVLAAQALAREAREPGFLARRLRYAKADLVSHSPITGKHVDTGMTVADLCAATVQYSDNTAANALMKELGGPAGLTAFMRGLGDTQFRLDRWETELNTAIPGDDRDTTTPWAMARTLEKLVIGDALPAPQRQQLKDWLLGNTTGGKRIRAAVPAGWQVGDKTGTGAYGVTNDIGIVYPPGRAPLVVVIFTHLAEKDGDNRDDIVVAAARGALGLGA